MGKKQSGKKRGRESARWEAEHATPPGMTRTIGFSCPRCGDDVGSVSDLPAHNQQAHLRGK